MKTQFDSKISLNTMQTQAISRLQNHYRHRRAHKTLEQAMGINIEKQSTQNILEIYQRLRHAEGLPAPIAEIIQKEKAHPSDVLTPDEVNYFKFIINSPFIANHASYNSNDITKSGMIYSTKELARKKIDVRTHTSPDLGEQEFAFFSYGLPGKFNKVSFLSGAHAFTINLDEFQKQFPEKFASSFTGGHFHAYSQKQKCTPIAISYKGNLTSIYGHYDQIANPCIQQVRHWRFVHSGMEMNYSFDLKQDVVIGKHIKSFHALKMIEFIRCLEPNLRQHLLQHTEDSQFQAEIFDLFFTPGKAEFLVPASAPVTNQDGIISVKFNEPAGLAYHTLTHWIDQDNIEALEQALKENPSLRTMTFDNKNKVQMSLLNYAVLKQNLRISQLLLRCGLNINNEYVDTKSPHILHHGSRTALLDAIEHKNKPIISLLCDVQHDKENAYGIIELALVENIHLFTAIVVGMDSTQFKMLLQQFMNYHQVQDLDEILIIAAMYNNIELLGLLLEAGANPNQSCHIRCSDQTLTIVPMSFESTALDCAAKFGHIEALEYLLTHGADVNKAVIVESDYNKEQKGNTPLITAIKNFAEGGFQLPYSIFCQPKEHLFYGRERNTEAYFKCIKALITADADIHYVNGKGNSFITIAQHYLYREHDKKLTSLINSKLTTPISELELAPQAKSVRYQTQRYALIINNEKGVPQLLLAQSDENEIWNLPGGTIDYFKDGTPGQGIINICALQTHINITPGASSHIQDHMCYDDPTRNEHNSLSVQTFALQENKGEVVSKTSKQAMRIADRNNRLDELKEIQYVNLKDIKVSTVRYKNLEIPLCLYHDQPLDLISSLPVAKLLGFPQYDTPEVRKLVKSLHFKSHSIISSHIKNNEFEELNALIALSLLKNTFAKTHLYNAIEDLNQDMVLLLINAGAMVPKDTLEWLLRHRLKNLSSSHDGFILMLFKIYATHYTEYTLGGIFETLSQYHFPQLIQYLRVSNFNWVNIYACRALRHGNIQTLDEIYTTLNEEQKKELIKQLINTLDSHYIEDKTLMDVYGFFAKHSLFHTLQLSHVTNLARIYEHLITEDSNHDQSQQCLDYIKILIEQKAEGILSREPYSFYVRLNRLSNKKKDPSKQAADDLLACLIKIPLMALEHATRSANPEDVFRILQKNKADSSIITRLEHITDTVLFTKVLKLAIEEDDVATFSLILSHDLKKNMAECYEELLSLTISLERIEMSNILISNGAKVSAAAQQKGNQHQNGVVHHYSFFQSGKEDSNELEKNDQENTARAKTTNIKSV